MQLHEIKFKITVNFSIFLLITCSSMNARRSVAAEISFYRISTDKSHWQTSDYLNQIYRKNINHFFSFAFFSQRTMSAIPNYWRFLYSIMPKRIAETNSNLSSFSKRKKKWHTNLHVRVKAVTDLSRRLWRYTLLINYSFVLLFNYTCTVAKMQSIMFYSDHFLCNTTFSSSRLYRGIAYISAY